MALEESRAKSPQDEQVKAIGQQGNESRIKKTGDVIEANGGGQGQGNGGGRTNNRRTKPRVRKGKYPPRTPEARDECKKVIAAMGGKTSKGRKAVSVMTHEDGTVSVGFSGEDVEKDKEYARQLEEKLNEGLDPKKYTVSGESMPKEGLRQYGEGNPAGRCAEAHVVQAAHSNPSKITGMDTRWRGKKENPHPYQGRNSDGADVEPDQMEPCETCGHRKNIRRYMNHANRNKIARYRRNG